MVLLPFVLSSLSICIAVAAFTVGFLNFRLSRFPHVRAIVNCATVTDHELTPPKTETRLEIEVESWGLPIWDMYAKLEGLYQRGEASMGLLQVVMPPVGNRPQPMAPGQVAKFRVSHEDIERGLKQWGTRAVGFSELPSERVSIAIYGSGGRLIKRIGRRKFPFHFKSFDCLKNSTPMEPIQMVLTSVNINPDET